MRGSTFIRKNTNKHIKTGQYSWYRNNNWIGENFISYSICTKIECGPIKYRYLPDTLNSEYTDIFFHIFAVDCQKNETNYCINSSVPLLIIIATCLI